MDEEILDSFITNPEERNYLESIKWWEKRRLWFNLLVGATGLISVLFYMTSFNGFDAFGIFIWGVVANIMYSTGLLLEIGDQYYFHGRVRIHRFRKALLVFGTAMYCLVSWLYTIMYYQPSVIW